MKILSNKQLKHLIDVVDRPDFSRTKYRIVSEIARGGMGTVYLAEDAQLAREVAIKVLNSAAENPEMRQRMRREAEIIARLEHPGIIPVHDVGALPDGRIFYVMKYVRGKRLDHHFNESVTRGERLRLFCTACEAVAFAHAHEVVHRDLKPENIMVGPFGEVLVMDWGIAKILGSTESPGISGGEPLRSGVTAHGTVLGTPSYMSPEQAKGDIAHVDRRADVFSLGSILYFLLAGEAPPAIGEGTSGLILAQPRTGVPRRLLAICAKAMAWNREDRYSDAQALAAEIDLYLDGKPIVAYRENLLELSVRWINRHRFLVFLVLAYILMRVILILTTNR